MTLLQEVKSEYGKLPLYVNGEYVESKTSQYQKVVNPAFDIAIAEVPFSKKEEVDDAIKIAEEAFEKWRELPITTRVGYIYKLKQMIDKRIEDIARITTQNHGKIIDEARGETRRLTENIETACSISYTLAKGEHLDQVATGIDETLVKEPLGVFGILGPFNFPSLAPFWFIPIALTVGCTVVVKPSEITPLPMQWALNAFDEVGFPEGVFNLVHGGKDVSEAITTSPHTRGVCFVGSTPVAKQVYKLAGEYGKRAICQAGAKNYVVVDEDADVDKTIQALMPSFFGNTGQRCLSGSNLVLIGGMHEKLSDRFVQAIAKMRLGYGLDESIEMGPVVTKRSKERITSYIQKGVDEGAKLTLDGRNPKVPDYPNGYFLGGSVFDDVTPDMTIAREEIFGPVASIIRAKNLREALDMINCKTSYGNAACLFTKNGKNAREFRRQANAGNIGINIGIAAAMAFFPFGGRRDSFFGTLHGQIDCVDFFTDKKVVIERW
ncbi:MAG: aldehyde dehydrogenase family protein [Nitrososphaeria archaeon]|jgi:malonate-semialdehyde dehydrogenase (acetylating)/methylmalonate-semialdehyde dehydrogenase